MAKTVKPKNEEVIESPVSEEKFPTPGVDISEDQKQEVAAVVESEETFLKKILEYQHNGGFGRHLDYMIYERLKLIKK